MNNDFSMDFILEAIAEGENPEESFNTAIAGTEKVAEAATPAAAPAKETETPETLEDTAEREKIAEAEAEGIIIARSFHRELQKLSVAPVAPTPPDTGAIPLNPAVEMARGAPAQRNVEAQSAGLAIIDQLTAANNVGAGEIHTPGQTQPLAKIDPMEGNPPLAADIAKAQEVAMVPGQEAVKTGAYNIVASLYNKYFGEGV